jgi:hypothetical protein
MAVVGTDTLTGVLPEPVKVAGTKIAAPQEHFPFLPAISGFHRKVLPHDPQGNLPSMTCSMILALVRCNGQRNVTEGHPPAAPSDLT